MIHTRLPVLGAIVLMIFNCGLAVAWPKQTSADYVMPGCRDAASLITFSTALSEEQVSLMGFCAGIVVGLSSMGEPYDICVPAGTSAQQTTSVVVQYIDGQPARIHEDFHLFAAEALRANWPCSQVASAREPLPTVAEVDALRLHGSDRSQVASAREPLPTVAEVDALRLHGSDRSQVASAREPLPTVAEVDALRLHGSDRSNCCRPPQPYYHGYYYHRQYPRYGYYGGGGWRTGNGCRPGWTVQGGVCKPYRYGPWDIYGGRQSDYGM
jgi:hypothetical protein